MHVIERLASGAIVEDERGERWYQTDTPTVHDWRYALQDAINGILTTAGDQHLNDAIVGYQQADGSIILPVVQRVYSNPRRFIHLHAHSEYCLAPETLVCTVDMVWKKIGDVIPGEVLVGFDEDLRPSPGQRGNSQSKMRPSTVIAAKRRVRDCYRITLEDGTAIISSAQHGWVVTGTTRGSLIEPDGPECGHGMNTRRWLTTERIAQRPDRLPKLVKWASPWGDVPPGLQREAAYLGGILDGEGWIHAGQLGVAQNPGPVLNEIKRCCEALGYPVTPDRVQGRGECRTFRFAGYETVLRVLSQCEPVRFRDRWSEVWEGRRAGGRYTRPMQIVSVEHVGEMETVALTTSTKTFVAEGFLSHNSPLDGLARIDEMVDEVIRDGQDALALTDHGVCAGHLELQKVCLANDIKPIFGLEAYLVDNRFVREGGQNYWHFILWAQNERGLHNLWALSTRAYREGLYYHPRMDWELLAEYNEGIAASTACLRGPIADAIRHDDAEAAIQRLGKLQAIYGDRLFMELHTNGLPDQVKVNKGLVSLAQERSIPMIVVADAHYACSADHEAHKVWIAMQTNKSLQDEGDLFDSDEFYHIHSVGEVGQAISYLGPQVVDEAIRNTGLVADMCDVTIKPRVGTPIYHRKEVPGKDLQGADLDRAEMVRICEENWDRLLSHVPPEQEQVYRDRLAFEVSELASKGFCGYMLIVWDYVDFAHRSRILVGPGRGSAAGSLVCYLLRITGVDPIEADLKFERFISPGRTELPDIDMDFPSSKRGVITDYIIQRWGEEHVVRVGTVGRLKNAGVFKGIAQAFKGTPDEVEFMDSAAISKIIEEVEQGTAGFGVTYEELLDHQAEPLAIYQKKYPKLFHYAEKLVGRLKTYGRHPAGVVIDPQNTIFDKLPCRIADDEHDNQVISQFPMDTLSWMNLIKFDILTLRTLDTLQAVMDLVDADPQMGDFRFDPNLWRDEYEDPMVWDALCAGDTMGVFQLETSANTTLTKKIQPRSLADLCAIGTLVRPGPARSGIQAAYIRRRLGLEPVAFDHPLLEDVLGGTYGLMIYQEDLMNICQVLGGYTSAEADEVRSILGKKKVDKIPQEGERFISRCTANGIPEATVVRMWEQMAEFAKYAFNKSHSWAYGVLGYWCAWAKVHLPQHFLVAAFNTADKKRIPDFITLARQLGYRVYGPDVNESEEGFTVSHDRLGVRYGIGSIKGLGGAKAQTIINQRPFTSFIEMAQSKVDFGSIKTLAQVGALDQLIPEGHNRSDLEVVIEQCASKGVERCAFTGPTNAYGLPCSFDWASEVVLGKSGKPLKQKPPPKKCTRACRHYTPEVGVEWPHLLPPRAKEIRQAERELLGVYVSNSPFETVSPELAIEYGIASLSEYEEGPYDERYKMLAEIADVRTRKDRNGRMMAFLDLTLRDGQINPVVFSSDWESDRSILTKDAFGAFVIIKGSRGPVYRKFVPFVTQE